jgi:hypothetical protein
MDKSLKQLVAIAGAPFDYVSLSANISIVDVFRSRNSRKLQKYNYSCNFTRGLGNVLRASIYSHILD